MTLKTVILTRLNVAIKGYDCHLNAEWLKERVRLLEEITAPSVRSQTDKDFEWVLLCDAGTPRDIWYKLLEHCDKISCSYNYGTGRGAESSIVPGMEPDDEVLTIRLDSDDAIAPTFVADAKRALPTVGTACFARGLKYKDGVVYDTYMHNSPFVIRREKVAGLETVYGLGNHSNLKERPVDAYEAWAQVIHGGNVCNQIKASDTRIDFVPEWIQALPFDNRDRCEGCGSDTPEVRNVPDGGGNCDDPFHKEAS